MADILGASTRREGWWPLDFRRCYRADEKWGKIHLIFVSDGFDGRDENESYRSIMDYVRIRSQDDSDLFGALGLVLQSFKQMNEGGIYSIGQAYSFVRPRDLIKRAIHEVGELTVKFAKNQRWADSDYFLFYRVDPTAEDRVGIRLAAPLEVSSLVGGRSSFSNYVKSRLIR